MKKKLLVSALENGTVIDHIPCDRTMDIINLLKINETQNTAVVCYNLNSEKMGKKSIIKVADKFFTDDEINQLSVIAADLSLCIIKNFEVVEKKQVVMPKELVDIVRCPNPKCISNNEPMHTVFHVINSDPGIIKCHYCEKEQPLAEAKLK